MNLDDSLRDKATTFGDFTDNAQLSQGLKFVMRRGKNWDNLDVKAKEALELIASSAAAILSGDANSHTHWNNLAAMARMMGKPLEDATVKNVGLGAVRKGLFQVAHDDGPDAA